MNPDSVKLCERLIPKTYVQQGVQARRSHENQIRHLLEQVSIRKGEKVITVQGPHLSSREKVHAACTAAACILIYAMHARTATNSSNICCATAMQITFDIYLSRSASEKVITNPTTKALTSACSGKIHANCNCILIVD